MAILAINGFPAASGNISAQGSSIQAEAPPGADVTAVIHTIPVFNGVLCIRLGELNVQLDECDLVGFDSGIEKMRGCLAQPAVATKDWYAWNDHMPPGPVSFHITGEVEVPNPGVEVLLVPKSPQGFNPKILLLDLILIQQPGNWPQMVVWKMARYDKMNASYSSVELFYKGNSVANVPVNDIQ